MVKFWAQRQKTASESLRNNFVKVFATKTGESCSKQWKIFQNSTEEKRLKFTLLSTKLSTFVESLLKTAKLFFILEKKWYLPWKSKTYKELGLYIQNQIKYCRTQGKYITDPSTDNGADPKHRILVAYANAIQEHVRQVYSESWFPEQKSRNFFRIIQTTTVLGWLCSTQSIFFHGTFKGQR